MRLEASRSTCSSTTILRRRGQQQHLAATSRWIVGAAGAAAFEGLPSLLLLKSLSKALFHNEMTRASALTRLARRASAKGAGQRSYAG
jgi:hypothetical protein